jgi:cell division protein FtsL
MIGILILSNVLVTVFTTAEGTKLGKLENQITQGKDQNRSLSSELVESSSLSQIKKSIAENGFAEPVSVVYLKEDPTVASLPGNF